MILEVGRGCRGGGRLPLDPHPYLLWLGRPVPNAKVANETIDNMGQRVHRRVKATIGLTYDTPPEQQAFVEDIRAHLETNPAVAEGTREVHLTAMGESSLDIMMYFFSMSPAGPRNWTSAPRSTWRSSVSRRSTPSRSRSRPEHLRESLPGAVPPERA